MTKSYVHGELRDGLQKAGMSADDLAWLDSIGWDDSQVPPIANDSEAQAYARREAALNGAVAQLLLVERKDRVETELAAAIGAALANWRERDDDED